MCVHLSIHWSTYLSIYLSIYLYLSISNYLAIYLSIYRSMSISIYLSIDLSTSIYLPISRSIYLYMYTYISTCVCVCVCVYLKDELSSVGLVQVHRVIAGVVVPFLPRETLLQLYASIFYLQIFIFTFTLICYTTTKKWRPGKRSCNRTSQYLILLDNSIFHFDVRFNLLK